MSPGTKHPGLYFGRVRRISSHNAYHIGQIIYVRKERCEVKKAASAAVDAMAVFPSDVVVQHR
jgi:hypothetical protein